jgi:phosphatidylinositol 4-kinase A
LNFWSIEFANILCFVTDFGFILDIAPGGITFESSPFKLTTEMIQVMGGRADVQQFKWFSELCIKAYLASR